MEPVSSRHEGDLGGLLDAFDPERAVEVAVIICDDWAESPAVQHSAWMLINLLARAHGIVARVLVAGPEHARVLERVVPFGSRGGLVERLLEGGSAIGVVPVERGYAGDYVVIVGPGPSEIDGVRASRVVGCGWWGAYAPAGIESPEAWSHADFSRDEPIGPYIGASLAAADIFLGVRAPQLRQGVAAHGWNSWSRQPEVIPTTLGARVVELELADIGLAGVGAVGAAWMHTLWASPGVTGRVLIADSDEEGVSTSNLNRGLLFTLGDVGDSKVAVASAAAQGAIDWAPHDGRFEAQSERPRTLVSAVDSNAARDALQSLYLSEILSGSTRDIRAEVMTVGMPGVGACLRCFNGPEDEISDAEVRDMAQGAGADLAIEAARELGIEREVFEEHLASTACDEVGDRMLTYLRDRFGVDAAPGRFAVGFTSLLAGTQLAAETLRRHFEHDRSFEASQRTSFQFRDPADDLNGVMPYLRDPDCPKCAPGSHGLRIWSARRLDR